MLGGTSDSKGKTFAHSSFDLTLFAKRGGARLAVEDRNFTEQFSGPQVRKDGLFAPRRRQRNTHRAHDDCHHAVAAIAEPTYRLASAETARLRIGSNIAPRFSSCVIPIPIPVPASAARAAARLEPPAQYNHAYNGQVVERVMPEAEVRSAHSRRIDPISLSAKPFCQGEPGAMGLSRMPMARNRRVTAAP